MAVFDSVTVFVVDLVLVKPRDGERVLLGVLLNEGDELCAAVIVELLGSVTV